MKEEYLRLEKWGETPGQAMDRLTDIVKLLRKECPWDKAQTHESLTRNMVEEAYEAVEAIKNQDMDNLCEELGDVVLQASLHSEIASEKDHFDITKVLNMEADKMIRRHPHIFSEYDAKTIDKVLEKWENIKDVEHNKPLCSQKLNKVPRSLPALIRADKVQEKAAKVGFDWEDATGAIDKFHEETIEFLTEYERQDKEKMKMELGDLLFSIVNVARLLDIDPEEAISNTTEKFIRRFTYVEETAISQGKELSSMSLNEMDQLWDEAKSFEKK
ncbi:MAG: nucleoside triphosphate pyrophosphohydrolase [Clostridia bacterium]|nr:nucleoside triphosphate pyrophosphohydrolase [Clostridia bacterium]